MSGIVFWILAFCSARTTSKYMYFLESPPLTKWGEWYHFDQCPPNSRVYGFQLRVHDFMNSALTDDTTLNGIFFLCAEPGSRDPRNENFGASPNELPVARVSSEVALNGELRREWQCSGDHYAIGFQIRVLAPQGIWWDDTAANNLILYCSGGESLLGDGIDLGVWTGRFICNEDRFVCGIQTQVEYSKGDDTALNNIKIGCCKPSYPWPDDK